MGARFTAHSIIGVRFSKDLLYKTVRRKAFEHDFPEDQNFCPETGKALWEDVKEPIPDYCDEGDSLGDYELVQNYDDDMLYCTLLHTEDGDYGRCDVLSLPSDLKKQKELMKSYLETLGLWDENSFGMYAFLEVS